MAYLFSPIFNASQQFTAAGLPLSGGLLSTFQAGTSTPLATATTSGAGVFNANPIQLGSDGTPPNEIWLSPTQAYKFILTDSTGSNPRTFDNVTGIDAAAAVLSGNLANTTDPAEGDALVGVKRTSIAAVASTLHNWIEGTVINASEAGIAPGNSSVSNTTLLNALILNSPGRRIYFPGYLGAYSFGDLILAGNTHYWFGDGVEGTKFVYTGTGTFINAEVTTDAFLPRSPIYLEGIGFSGTTKTTQVGLSIKNRHDYSIRNCTFDHFSTLIRLNTAYIGEFDNVNGTDCDVGWDLVGDINRVTFRSCGITSFVSTGVHLRTGTFGCLAVVFDNCDLEFAAGACVLCETNDVITFRDCYLGDTVTGDVFQIIAGQLVVDGGLVSYGQNSSFTNRLVEFFTSPFTDQQSLTITNAKINGGTYCGPDAEKMVKGPGKLVIENCGVATQPAWPGALVAVIGDPFGRAPGMNALASSLGRSMTSGVTGGVVVTTTASTATDSLFVQCTTAGSGTDNMFLRVPIPLYMLRTFGAVGMIMVYKSNAPFSVQLASSATTFNTSPKLPFSTALPNTTSALMTAVVVNQDPLSADYSVLEVYRTGPSVSHFIEIVELYLFDDRQSGPAGTLYSCKNLYKPV